VELVAKAQQDNPSQKVSATHQVVAVDRSPDWVSLALYHLTRESPIVEAEEIVKEYWD
jgi:hypothetical protein